VAGRCEVADTSSLGSLIALLDALERGQLFVEYQAVFATSNGQLRGAEALLRWDRGALGVVGPADFLPMAMRGGLGGQITAFVLDRAAAQCAAWRIVGQDIPVSVNVSPATVSSEDVPAMVDAALSRHGLPADRLTVEVTEQACGIDPTGLRDTFTSLARMGVRLSLDDFGMGESSLSRLQQLHFDEVKIDRSFVRGVCSEPTDRSIVTFASRLAQSLGMKVVAEGVETSEVLAELRMLGPDLVQGYHLHRPSPPDALADLAPVGDQRRSAVKKGLH
jgi:EAL domain-containing protein (putative c-di-GMP-specific phosphodiesterase class I)